MPYEGLFRMSPGKNRLLYLEEIPVNGYTSADTAKLRDKVYSIMEKKMIEYNGGWRKE
jgi:1-acyl-sn-glycerol-3-phosphate acyltransferase